MIWKATDGVRVRELTNFRSGLFSAATSHSGELLVLAGGGYGEGGDLSIWTLKDQSAADLARCHGLYVVARSLKLDYSTLKNI